MRCVGTNTDSASMPEMLFQLAQMKKRRPIFNLFAVVNLALLIMLFLLERFVGEGNWLVTLATYAPPVIYAPFTLVLLLAALARRNRPAVAVNVFAIVFLVFALLGLRLHWPDASPADLRVMTFNVEKWSHGTAAVAEAIRGQKPDVVCLQEAGTYFWLTRADQTPTALERAMPEYDWTASGEIMVGSRLPVIARKVHPLPPGPEERPAVEVVVNVGGKRVSVVSVHLIPSQFDNVFREPGKASSEYINAANAARMAQVRRLLLEMRPIANSVIIGGDLNAQPQTWVCRRLTDVYADAFDAAGNGFGYTITANFPATRSDHLLLGGGVRALSAFVPVVHASDHRPLVADLSIP